MVRQWLILLHTYGVAMIQLRSKEGFLKRLRERDAVIETVRDAWERPIRALLREFAVPDSEFEYALFLYNLLFDPRELLDLADLGLSDDEILNRQTTTFYAALRALSSSEDLDAR